MLESLFNSVDLFKKIFFNHTHDNHKKKDYKNVYNRIHKKSIIIFKMRGLNDSSINN